MHDTVIKNTTSQPPSYFFFLIASVRSQPVQVAYAAVSSSIRLALRVCFHQVPPPRPPVMLLTYAYLLGLHCRVRYPQMNSTIYFSFPLPHHLSISTPASEQYPLITILKGPEKSEVKMLLILLTKNRTGSKYIRTEGLWTEAVV